MFAVWSNPGQPWSAWKPSNRKAKLPLEVVIGGIPCFVAGRRITDREPHDQSNGQQRHHQHQKDSVHVSKTLQDVPDSLQGSGYLSFFRDS